MFTHLGEFIMAFKRGKCTSLVQRTDLALPSSWVVPRPVGKDKHKNKQPPIMHSWCCSPPQNTIILSKRGKQMIGINKISSAASLPIYTTAKIRNSLCLSMNYGSCLVMNDSTVGLQISNISIIIWHLQAYQVLGKYRLQTNWGSFGQRDSCLPQKAYKTSSVMLLQIPVAPRKSFSIRHNTIVCIETAGAMWELVKYLLKLSCNVI